jgi:hypothetical protein
MTKRRLPIPSCAAICKNVMNEVCIEECAPKRDCSSFEVTDVSLPEMPQYPETKGMTWKERFVIEEAYLKKTIDFIQGGNGASNELYSRNPRRDFPHSKTSHGDHRNETFHGLQDDSSRNRVLPFQPQETVGEMGRSSEVVETKRQEPSNGS